MPIDASEESAPVEDRYLRFTDVNGTLEVGEQDAAAAFTAKLHGSDCTLEAGFFLPAGEQPTFDSVGFELDATVNDLVLPRRDAAGAPHEDRLINRWKRLADFYRDFDAHGPVNLTISLAKEPGPTPIQLKHAVLEAIGCDASYRWFPYRVTGITGTVEYRSDGIFLQNLSGEHAGGRVTVNGVLDEPRWYCAADLRISGNGIPADGDLHDALRRHYQEIWDQFNLHGGADIEVTMRREKGTRDGAQPYRTTVDVHLRDASAEFVGFRYPVKHITGRLHISDNGLNVTDVTGSAGEGRVSLNGSAHFAESATQDLDLQLDAEGIAFDEVLYKALADRSRRILERFNPSGRFDLIGRLTLGGESGRRLVHDLTVVPDSVTVTHRDPTFAVEQLTGRIHLSPDRITVEELSGRHNAAAVTADGFFDISEGSGAAELTVRCAGLMLEDELDLILPDRLRSSWGDLHLAGPVDTITVLDRCTANAETDRPLRTTLTARGVTITHPTLPVPVDNVRGGATIAEGLISLNDLTGKYGDATLSLSGEVQHKDGALDGRLRATVVNLAVDERLRLALPWRLRRTWNNVRPIGVVDVDLPRLEFTRQPSSELLEWDFDTVMAFRDAGLDTGVELRNCTGTLSGVGQITGADHDLLLAADLAVDRVALDGRPITDLTGTLLRSTGDPALVLSDLRGTICEGAITADVQVGGPPGRFQYACTATISRMDLQKFLHSRSGSGSSEPRSADATGSVDGHLYLSGEFGDPRTARGGGRIGIREARMFRLPLLLSVLDVLDLTAPEQTGLQSASAEFFLKGREIELRDLLLRSSTVAMIGAGRLHRDPLDLDLRLVAVSPNRWFRLPVLTEFLEGTSRELVEIRVQGPLADPVLSAAPLRGVGEVVETLLGQGDAELPDLPSP